MLKFQNQGISLARFLMHMNCEITICFVDFQQLLHIL